MNGAGRRGFPGLIAGNAILGKSHQAGLFLMCIATLYVDLTLKTGASMLPCSPALGHVPRQVSRENPDPRPAEFPPELRGPSNNLRTPRPQHPGPLPFVLLSPPPRQVPRLSGSLRLHWPESASCLAC